VKVILLNGARREAKTGNAIKFEAADELPEAARRNPDAVVFGYMSGTWVAAA
jgi:hypothetical protein